MNKDLVDKQYNLPNDLIDRLRALDLNNVQINNFISTGYLTYYDMKNVLKNPSPSIMLNNWVKFKLNADRSQLNNHKKHIGALSPTNAHRKSHNKRGNF